MFKWFSVLSHVFQTDIFCTFSKHWYVRFAVYTDIFTLKHSHKKRKDSLESSMDRVLFAAEFDFPKILVPRLPQNTSNVNIECTRKSKQLYSLCDQLLGVLIYLNFIILILIWVLIEDAWSKLCKIWLLLYETTPGVSLYRSLTLEEKYFCSYYSK